MSMQRQMNCLCCCHNDAHALMAASLTQNILGLLFSWFLSSAEAISMALLHLSAILLLTSHFIHIDCFIASDRRRIKSGNSYDTPEDIKIVEDKSWSGLHGLGQVSGIAVDGDGNIHVFHRGDRFWDKSTFDQHGILRNKEDGPIKNKTILVVDPNTEKVIYSWGDNRFYMPHGITIDGKGNTWITDVGLQQVMKFPARETEPTLVLGEAFVPGLSKHHFCKPTDVVVTELGHFFVSDGYCNSRIVMFSRNGAFLREIGAEDKMVIPHSLTLFPQFGMVCVADREKYRILCYTSGVDGNIPGIRMSQYAGEGLGRPFTIDRRRDQLFAVNGPDPFTGAAGYGMVIDTKSGSISNFWAPKEGFAQAHAMAISPDGKFVYVTEIDTTDPKRVHKFKIQD